MTAALHNRVAARQHDPLPSSPLLFLTEVSLDPGPGSSQRPPPRPAGCSEALPPRRWGATHRPPPRTPRPQVRARANGVGRRVVAPPRGGFPVPAGGAEQQCVEWLSAGMATVREKAAALNLSTICSPAARPPGTGRGAGTAAGMGRWLGRGRGLRGALSPGAVGTAGEVRWVSPTEGSEGWGPPARQRSAGSSVPAPSAVQKLAALRWREVFPFGRPCPGSVLRRRHSHSSRAAGAHRVLVELRAAGSCLSGGCLCPGNKRKAGGSSVLVEEVF